jgi:hypothetical protein
MEDRKDGRLEALHFPFKALKAILDLEGCGSVVEPRNTFNSIQACSIQLSALRYFAYLCVRLLDPEYDLITLREQEKPAKLKNLVRRDVIVGDPEDLVHLDWSKECSKSAPEIHLIDSLWLKRLHGTPD